MKKVCITIKVFFIKLFSNQNLCTVKKKTYFTTIMTKIQIPLLPDAQGGLFDVISSGINMVRTYVSILFSSRVCRVMYNVKLLVHMVC